MVENYHRKYHNEQNEQGLENGELLIECDLFSVDFEKNLITFQLTPDQITGKFRKGKAIIDLSEIREIEDGVRYISTVPRSLEELKKDFE